MAGKSGKKLSFGNAAVLGLVLASAIRVGLNVGPAESKAGYAFAPQGLNARYGRLRSGLTSSDGTVRNHVRFTVSHSTFVIDSSPLGLP